MLITNPVVPLIAEKMRLFAVSDFQKQHKYKKLNVNTPNIIEVTINQVERSALSKLFDFATKKGS
jgi:hypothetical protein